MAKFLRILQSPKTAAVAMVAVGVYFMLEPKEDPAILEQLASKYKFEASRLDSFQRKWKTTDRFFAPELKHLEGWLGAFVPAGLAVGDLAHSGEYRDLCHTDAYERRAFISRMSADGKAHRDLELTITPTARGPLAETPSGCLFGDYNEDGMTDVLVYFWGRTPLAFLQKPSAGADNLQFSPVSIASEDQRWYTQSVTSADVDGDGHLDLVFANYFPDDAKVLDDDLGGRSVMNFGAGNALNAAKKRLLLGRAATPKMFEEADGVFAEAQGGDQWTIAAGAADIDGDLLPEIFFINDHGPDRLLHNRSTPGSPKFELIEGKRSFFTPKSMTLGKDGFHGMGLDFFDLNHDGFLDAMVSNFTSRYVFYQGNFVWMSTGDKNALAQNRSPFENKSEPMGLARTKIVPWDVRFVDALNNGNPAIVQATGFMRGQTNKAPEVHEIALTNDEAMQFPLAWPNFRYEDEVGGTGFDAFYIPGPTRYTDIGEKLALQAEGPGRGVAVTDLNSDGKLDVLISNQRADALVLLNQSPGGASLELDLQLSATSVEGDAVAISDGTSLGTLNQPAIGASVKLTRHDGVVQLSNVDGGSGFCGKKAPLVHFGLGETSATTTQKVDIAWKDRTGTNHQKQLSLTPGRYRVYLGSNSKSMETH